MSTETIHVNNVCKVFKRYEKQERIIDNFFHRKYTEKVAVENVTFDISKGECVAIIGQNGAGKTTLMKMMSGLLLPTFGEISVLGHDPFKKQKDFKKKIALVMGQKQQLWWDVSAKDNFLLLKDIYEMSDSDYNNNLGNLVELLELSEIMNNPVRTLSLGERMKCELAGSLLYKPEVLFLDEPTIGLDLLAQNDVRIFVKKYSEQNQATVMLTSHNMGDIEAVCDRTIFVESGKLFYDGKLKDFVKEYGKDGIVKVDIVGKSDSIDWKKYGKVIEHSKGVVRLRVSKESVNEIRHELQDLSGVVNTSFDELDAEEIVRIFYEKGK